MQAVTSLYLTRYFTIVYVFVCMFVDANLMDWRPRGNERATDDLILSDHVEPIIMDRYDFTRRRGGEAEKRSDTTRPTSNMDTFLGSSSGRRPSLSNIERGVIESMLDQELSAHDRMGLDEVRAAKLQSSISKYYNSK